MKNEKTGPKVAKIAAKALAILRKYPRARNVWVDEPWNPQYPPNDTNPLGFGLYGFLTVAELKSLAASALTQPDRKKR